MKTKCFFRQFTLLLLLIFFSDIFVHAQITVVSGGTGAPAGSGVNGANNAGGDATGLGCGGGGGSWWGGTGGAGKFGGGGGGAGGYFSLGTVNWAGGEGGQGVVVIAYYNGASLVSAQVISTGISVTVGAGITSAKVWAIGGGGGGGGATDNDGTSGGSGGAGGVAYITKAVTNGSIISFTIGAGGTAGHGAVAGTAGGNTSVTISGTTIYGNGGAAGLYNNSGVNAAGGTYSGGDGGATGGAGYGRTGDVGGGGGAGIGGAAGTQNSTSGGTGANAVDVSGLFAACAAATGSALPYITSFSPTTGLSGTIMTITGSGFTGATAVKIGGVAVTSFTVNSNTQITATVSPVTVSGSVSVTCTYVTLSMPIYLFQAPVAPTIGSFSPTTAAEGTVITISGNKFLGASSVTFGGTPAASFTVTSDFQILATVEHGSGGAVSVTSSSGTGSLAGFSWQSITQATSVGFTSVTSTQMTINWTTGSGSKRIVFVKQGTGAITDPTDRTTYTASTNWTSKGTQLGATGYYCVYNGSGSSVTLTGLNAGTQYTVQVMEYNGAAGAEMYYTATSTNNPKSNSTLGTLPLTWLSFTGQITKDAGIALKWTVACEQNTRDFVIQHSTNGMSWLDAGVVKAQNDPAQQFSYTYLHADPAVGANYYRILQRDLDGKSSYSKVIVLQYTSQSFRILNNPVEHGVLRYEVTSPCKLSVFNLEGKQLLSRNVNTGSGEFQVGALPEGIYLIKAGDMTRKFLIRRL